MQPLGLLVTLLAIAALVRLGLRWGEAVGLTFQALFGTPPPVW